MRHLSIPLILLATLACSAETDPATTPTSRPANQPGTPETTLVVGHVGAEGAARLIDAGTRVVVLDVRTPGEFAEGHIDGAVNIDFMADDFEKRVDELDRDAHYLIHCKSGGRSTRALPTLEKLGFASVSHLDGGFMAWEKAGQPVQK